jgi:hypothetical protein
MGEGGQRRTMFVNGYEFTTARISLRRAKRISQT